MWVYVLREAHVTTGGARLGPVGARIVAETIIGLLQMDRDSVLSAGWRPSLPQRDGRTSGEFTMVDFLTFAGVDPATRGQ